MNTAEHKTIYAQVKSRLSEIFDLERDKANEHYTIEAIKDEVDFRGAKVWILIFAILIASLGLNVNSTAVIIGAMLISPLMGPIVGFGLGLGISDLTLIKRSLRNLGIMTLISIATATLYFLISPLSQAQSELLARTQPTIYDVLIAFVGGGAGLLASSTRNKGGSVITGVAIATALMPPLCTAGYGLSQGNWAYFFGAVYLYLINSVFIGLATFAMVRVLRFPRKPIMDHVREQRLRRWVVGIAVGTILPSIYFGFLLVRTSVAEDGVHRFVADHLNTTSNQVVRQSLAQQGNNKRLEVVLLGQELSETYLDSIRAFMPQYGLGGVDLVVRQGFGGKVDEIDVDLLKTEVLQDLYNKSDQTIRAQAKQIDSLERLLSDQKYLLNLQASINQEAHVLFSGLKHFTIAQALSDSTIQYICIYQSTARLSSTEEQRLESWLRTRLNSTQIAVLHRK